MLFNLITDLKFNLRLIWKNRVYTLICVSVIAAGIAIMLPAYSFIENIAFKTVPVSQRLVALIKMTDGVEASGEFTTYDFYHFQQFNNRARSLNRIYAWKDANATLSDGEYAQTFRMAVVEPDFQNAGEMNLVSGRALQDADTSYDAEDVAVISFDLWGSYFNSDSSIIGKTVKLNGKDTTVIGVASEGYGFPWSHHVWTPLKTLSFDSNPGGEEDLILVGELASGYSLEDANRELGMLEEQLKNSLPEQYKNILGTRVAPYLLMRGNQPNGSALFAIIAFSIILLIAVNVSNLFLTRGEERIQELAVRNMLGEGPRKITFTLMQESFVICVFGLVTGLVLCILVLRYIARFVNISAPQLAEVFWWDLSLNFYLFFIGILLVMAIWALSGYFPAWKISRRDLTEYLGSSGKGVGSTSNSMTSRILVNLQLIFGTILLSVGLSSAMLISQFNLTEAIDDENKFTGSVSFPADMPASERTSYLEQYRQALLQSTEVAEVAFASAIPGISPSRGYFDLDGEDLLFNNRYPTAYVLNVSENYIDYFGIEIPDGRSFNAGDTSDSEPVAIVDEIFAQRYWPNESPVGKRVKLNPEMKDAFGEYVKVNGQDSVWATVIGVSSYVPQAADLGDAREPTVYRPLTQAGKSAVQVIITSKYPEIDFVKLLRNAGATVNKDIPIDNANKLSTAKEALVTAANFTRSINIALIVIALYVTGFATYGLTARSVLRRRAEVGIRMALGATPVSCVLLFLKDSFVNNVVGLVLGCILSIMFSYFLLSESGITGEYNLLIPISIGICLTMAIVVLIASLIPSAKLAKLEPSDALRHD